MNYYLKNTKVETIRQTKKFLTPYFEVQAHYPTFLFTQDKFPDSYAAFKHSGFILQSDFDELAYIKLQNKRCVYMNRDYHLTINPTLDCNLKCWYCSVGYAGTKYEKDRMSDQVVDSLLKHIQWLITEQKANSILLDWFGGEPLMYFDEVIKVVSKFTLPLARQNGVALKQQITTFVFRNYTDLLYGKPEKKYQPAPASLSAKRCLLP